jgi:hypothetical protein
MLTLRTSYPQRVLPSIDPVRNFFKIKIPVILLSREVTIGIKKKLKWEVSISNARGVFTLGVRDSSVKSLNIMLVIWDLVLLTMVT